MDNELTNEQQGNLEANEALNQETSEIVNDTQDTDSYDNDVSGEGQDNVSEGGQQQVEEKIKLGDVGEYTPEEILEIIKNSKQQVGEQQVSEQQYRDEKVIDADIERINNDRASDTLTMFKKYLSLANVPSDDVNAPYNALREGINTGNFDRFIDFLSPIHVASFINEQIGLNSKYEPEFKKLEEEKNKTKSSLEYSNNLKSWDEFIKNDCKVNPAAQQFFNSIKKDTYFDKNYASKMFSEFNKAILAANNKKVLNEQTDALKKAMMNSSISSGGGQKQHIYTAEEIGRMSQKQYDKVEKIIDEQYKKGLIK